MKDEDYAFEQRRQQQLDSGVRRRRVAWRSDFSRTVDRDPNPRIPLSVPERLPAVSKREAVFWAVLVGLWMVYLFFGGVR